MIHIILMSLIVVSFFLIKNELKISESLDLLTKILFIIIGCSFYASNSSLLVGVILFFFLSYCVIKKRGLECLPLVLLPLCLSYFSVNTSVSILFLFLISWKLYSIIQNDLRSTSLIVSQVYTIYGLLVGLVLTSFFGGDLAALVSPLDMGNISSIDGILRLMILLLVFYVLGLFGAAHVLDKSNKKGSLTLWLDLFIFPVVLFDIYHDQIEGITKAIPMGFITIVCLFILGINFFLFRKSGYNKASFSLLYISQASLIIFQIYNGTVSSVLTIFLLALNLALFELIRREKFKVVSFYCLVGLPFSPLFLLKAQSVIDFNLKYSLFDQLPFLILLFFPIFFLFGLKSKGDVIGEV